MPGPSNGAPLRVRFAFWVLLTMLSTGFAEVVSGAMPWPFFNPWGIVVTTPIYGLHAVALITVLVRLRALTWPGLLFAGALFGLYEAYITKVLFHPHFGDSISLTLGGVAWHHVALLVLWWHPLMSFIIPLVVAETFLTSSRTLRPLMPPRPRWWSGGTRRARWMPVLLGATCALFLAMAPERPVDAFLVAAVNAGLVAGLMAVFARWTGRRYPLHALLPGRAGLGVLGVLLAVQYGLTGFFLLRPNLPGLEGHVTVSCCYAACVLLLLRMRGRGRVPVAEEEALAPRPPWGALVRFCAALVLCAPLFKLGFGRGLPLMFAVNWALADTVGVLYYAGAVRDALWRRPAPTRGTARGARAPGAA